MRVERFIVLLLVAILGWSCQNAPEISVQVRECAPLPCGGRASACACVLDGKAYVFAGRDKEQQRLNDLWCYDASTDSWTNLGETPMKARVNAVITTDGNKLYAGLGYSETKAYIDTAYMTDWWEYTPSSKEWKRLADFQWDYTVAANAFVIDGNIYVTYGTGPKGFERHIYTYSIASDSWEMKPDNRLRPTRNFGGRGAWLGGLYYYGTGENTTNLRRWWVSDVVSDEWTEVQSIPGKGRQFCACAASKQYVYLFGGQCFHGDLTGGEIFNTFMRYNPNQDQWSWCGTMPCGRAFNQIAFSINGKVYFGFGEDENRQVHNCLYCVEE